MHELAGWISVLSWLDQWKRAGVALCAGALEERRDPAACYRLVQRITGVSWGDLQAAGLRWALNRFAERCRWYRATAIGATFTARYDDPAVLHVVAQIGRRVE